MSPKGKYPKYPMDKLCDGFNHAAFDFTFKIRRKTFGDSTDPLPRMLYDISRKCKAYRKQLNIMREAVERNRATNQTHETGEDAENPKDSTVNQIVVEHRSKTPPAVSV
ncbi:uncharacterized protein LOC129576349 [Sitodiplosis mosellana]|uniref:uncharacterized protein LOC129576349 n=1 Tax=Sitodiplosis mosellana TaxID=263140 RepID=UPI00244453A2|nr:uncharacterized protein LOC129576349 [Sitodiplosis mosellana]